MAWMGQGLIEMDGDTSTTAHIFNSYHSLIHTYLSIGRMHMPRHPNNQNLIEILNSRLFVVTDSHYKYIKSRIGMKMVKLRLEKEKN